MQHNGNGIGVVESIDHMIDKLNVDAVFGQPQHEGDVTIIPVAKVRYGFGLGQGYSRADEAATEKDAGHGEGGGGGGSAKPQGFLRISAEGIRYEPITHPEWVPLAGMAMVAWAVLWLGMTIRAIARAFAKRKK